jgi:hypothetical protein
MGSGSRSGRPADDGDGDGGDAGPKVRKVKGSRVADAGGESTFPSIMTDEQVDDAAATRRHERHDPYRRKDKPDPWPIIERGFPRIAERIREMWGKRALDDYFAELVVDERGSRQGFPPEVLSAILEVARLHAGQYRFHRPMCPWEADVRQTKWWAKG